MIRIEKSVKAQPADVLEQAEKQLGPQGLGLTIVRKLDTCIDFSGSGGFVNVTACRDESKTQVEVTAREWDEQAKSFMAGLH